MVTCAPRFNDRPAAGREHRHAPTRPWSPLRLGLATRLGMALGGIGLVWSAIALGLA